MALAIFFVAAIAVIIAAAFYWNMFQYLSSENQMLWQLLFEQAELHQMSLDAYVNMLREAQKHTDDLLF